MLTAVARSDNDTIGNAAAATISGSSAWPYLGYTLGALDDIDGDGVNELLAGNHSYSGTAGAAFLFSGPGSSGALTPADADVTWTAGGPGEYTGYRVGGLGDPDGDGVANSAISAHYNDDGASNAGAVFLFFSGY